MEFLFLVCQQPGCRQLSPSQGGKTPVTPSCLARISWADTCLPFITQLQSPESGFETTCLVVSSYSDGFTWEALSKHQNHIRKGPFGRLEYLFTPAAPRVVGPNCQVRKEAEKALKFPAKSGVCVSDQVLRPVKRGGEAGVGTESSGRTEGTWPFKRQELQ